MCIRDRHNAFFLPRKKTTTTTTNNNNNINNMHGIDCNSINSIMCVKSSSIKVFSENNYILNIFWILAETI